MAKGEGQGEGRGGCVSPGEAWEMVKEWGYNIMCAICCALCIGPVCILIGIIFLVSAVKDERGDNVKKFNEGVAQYGAIQTTWDARSFTSTIPGLSKSNTETFDVADSKLAQWTPIIWTTTGAPSGFTGSTGGVVPSPAVLTISESSSALTPDNPVAQYTKTLRPGSSSSTTTTTSSPPTPPPPPSPPTYAWTKLSKVCRQAAEGAGNGYNTADGGVGCFAALGSSYTNGLTYSSCGSTTQDTQTPSGCASHSVQLQLRSAKDPVILGFKNGACGRNPSNDKCYFGVSRGTKVAFGLIFLILGIVFTCCVYGGLYCVILWFQKRDK